MNLNVPSGLPGIIAGNVSIATGVIIDSSGKQCYSTYSIILVSF